MTRCLATLAALALTATACGGLKAVDSVEVRDNKAQFTAIRNPSATG
ncbi:MAG: hypothetical protein Q4P33_05095 [Flaviflexus sp.]|nr:hypothetical protein [Flaviflexus sp.]